MKLPLSRFLASVEQIAAEKPTYQLGHDGSDGRCDCIGLVIGAIRRAGSSWEGIHGSNYAARNEMDSLLPIAQADELSPGELVYKASSPGQSNHNLPSRYSDHPDQHDYYHVGVVRSVTPLEIIHCTGPGIVVDTKLGKWNYHGWLSKLSQEGDPTVNDTQTARVTADAGSTVNLRRTPDGDLLTRVPLGATVIVTARQDSWSRVSYNGQIGWMMDQYLDTVTPSDKPTGDAVSITLPRALAEQLRDCLAEAVGWG